MKQIGKKMYGIMREQDADSDIVPNPICINDDIDHVKKNLDKEYPLLVVLEITGVYEEKEEKDGEMLKGFIKIA